MSQVPAFATADPAHGMTEASPGHVRNLVAGSWLDADHVRDDIIDPMNSQRFLHVSDTRVHTPEAIIATWSGRREIVSDQGPLPDGWSTPPPT